MREDGISKWRPITRGFKNWVWKLCLVILKILYHNMDQQREKTANKKTNSSDSDSSDYVLDDDDQGNTNTDSDDDEQPLA
jgi:hypothetical protein